MTQLSISFEILDEITIISPAFGPEMIILRGERDICLTRTIKQVMSGQNLIRILLSFPPADQFVFVWVVRNINKYLTLTGHSL